MIDLIGLIAGSPGAIPAAPLLMQQVLDRPLTQREREAVLTRIQALMEFWDIRCDELVDDSSPALRVQPQPEMASSGGIKYRHPQTGETWDGTGLHPEWLRRALLQEGLRVDELRPHFGSSLQPQAQTQPVAPTASLDSDGS